MLTPAPPDGQYPGLGQADGRNPEKASMSFSASV
jgi:hypothetical protein